MTLQEKLSEIAHYDKSSYNSIARRSAVKMYEWTIKKVMQYITDEFRVYDFSIDDGFDVYIDYEAIAADLKRFVENKGNPSILDLS